MSAERLVGAYRYSDGFWSWEMHLIPRGRYEVFAVTDILVESEDGKLKRDTYRVAHGGWTVDAGSVVLRRDDGIANFWAVVLVGGRVALMEPSESRGLHRLFTRTNRPVKKRRSSSVRYAVSRRSA